MLRRELLSAVHEVEQLLRKSNVFRAITPRDPVKLAGVPLTAFQEISRAEPALSQAARELMDIFELNDLFSADSWQQVITGDSKPNDKVAELRYSLR